MHHTEETIAKISKGAMGHKVSEETKIKQSKNVTGENNPFYGKQHTKEWKQEHSRKMSGEGNPMYGKQHTKETKAKQSEIRKEYYKTHKK